MAERRMFSKTVINSDNFLDMPTSARCLYLHLGMMADDDGFVGSPKAIIRSSNCSIDDLKLLIAKGFLISFDSGIVVLRHWKMHNYIQKDRYRHTQFRKECEQLAIENGIYQECTQDVSMLDTECIQDVHGTDTQDSIEIGKDIDRVRNTYCAEPETLTHVPAVIELVLNDKTLYPITQNDIDEWQDIYPAVDIFSELRKMKGWLYANPQKRKTRRGIRRFINNWLAREQDRGGVKNHGTESESTESTSSAKLW